MVNPPAAAVCGMLTVEVARVEDMMGGEGRYQRMGTRRGRTTILGSIGEEKRGVRSDRTVASSLLGEGSMMARSPAIDLHRPHRVLAKRP